MLLLRLASQKEILAQPHRSKVNRELSSCKVLTVTLMEPPRGRNREFTVIIETRKIYQ